MFGTDNHPDSSPLILKTECGGAESERLRAHDNPRHTHFGRAERSTRQAGGFLTSVSGTTSDTTTSCETKRRKRFNVPVFRKPTAEDFLKSSDFADA